ncbi:MAG: hypothetical protein MZU84_02045 [Sphingobacterium sp.]|nr:hypothetical protein [Sphingobacterium sp.]
MISSRNEYLRPAGETAPHPRHRIVAEYEVVAGNHGRPTTTARVPADPDDRTLPLS